MTAPTPEPSSRTRALPAAASADATGDAICWPAASVRRKRTRTTAALRRSVPLATSSRKPPNPCSTVMVRATLGAAAHVPFPGWSARTTHAPAP